jgi:hypothetical protein
VERGSYITASEAKSMTSDTSDNTLTTRNLARGRGNLAGFSTAKHATGLGQTE